MEDEIWFYDHKQSPYGKFSNFAETPFIIDGVKYFTSEAFFQSKKFDGPDASDIDLEYSKLIASQKTGGKAAILARQAKPVQNYAWARELWAIIQEYVDKGAKIRPDWDKIKDSVMRTAVYHKFNQNVKLKQLLLDTGTKQIFEHTHRDLYWADGHPKNNSKIHGDGKNMLGKILEETRFVLGGKPSDRYEDMFISGGRWLIPGLFLLSDVRADLAIEQSENKTSGSGVYIEQSENKTSGSEFYISKGYRYVLAKDIPYGCTIRNKAIVANWKNSSVNKLAIARTIVLAINNGFPVVMPLEQIEITDIAMKLIWGY